MRRLTTVAYWIAAFVWTTGCNVSDKQSKVLGTTEYDLQNPVVQEIFNLQDQRKGKELAIYLSHVDPSYRYLAAMAFASVQDTADANIVKTLGELLNADPDEAVRFAAATALGNFKTAAAAKALAAGFKNDKTTGSNRINAAILEGIGKCAPASYLPYLLRPKNYAPKDTAIVEGQCYGIYRFAMRDITSAAGTQKMIGYSCTQKYPVSVRRIAANYLARTRTIVLTEYADSIMQALSAEPDAYVRIALATSLVKAEKRNLLTEQLLPFFDQEKDTRVKFAVLRLASSMDYDIAKLFYGKAYNSTNRTLKLATVGFYRTNGDKKDVDAYFKMAMDSTLTDKEVKIGLLGATLANIQYTRANLRTKINDLLLKELETAKNMEQKGLVLTCLSSFPANYKLLESYAFNTQQPAYVRTKAMEGLMAIRKNPKLGATFGWDFPIVEKDFKRIFKTALKTSDVSMVYLAAETMQDRDLGMKEIFRGDFLFMDTVLRTLKLPRDIEAYNELLKVRHYFRDDTAKLVLKPLKYNHPIEWNVLANLTDASFARVKTKKGEILIAFFARQSPASVANFVKLTNDGFFNKKTFHRVVPNFVVQTGCPRGDGMGSLDYSLRTEVNDLKFNEEGYVGMASAGKDTEGTQWFITHAPAMHLDGNYTIFGKVVKGMEVVRQLEIGDLIEKVIIETPQPVANN